jgi:hypothetical protein
MSFSREDIFTAQCHSKPQSKIFSQLFTSILRFFVLIDSSKVDMSTISISINTSFIDHRSVKISSLHIVSSDHNGGVVNHAYFRQFFAKV